MFHIQCTVLGQAESYRAPAPFPTDLIYPHCFQQRGSTHRPGLASSPLLLIDKTQKPAHWNSEGKREKAGLESNRWQLQQSNNLPSRAILIKICSLITSFSPLLFKFIHSLLSQPPSDRSQRCYPIQSPLRGKGGKGDTAQAPCTALRLQCSAGGLCCFGKTETTYLVELQALANRKQ